MCASKTTVDGEDISSVRNIEFWFKFLHVFTINLQMEEDVLCKNLIQNIKANRGCIAVFSKGFFSKDVLLAHQKLVEFQANRK